MSGCERAHVLQGLEQTLVLVELVNAALAISRASCQDCSSTYLGLIRDVFPNICRCLASICGGFTRIRRSGSDVLASICYVIQRTWQLPREEHSGR